MNPWQVKAWIGEIYPKVRKSQIFSGRKAFSGDILLE